jgi:NodT family efflux transporter outer membrane factor (OMF) lipoprotein
VAADAAQIPVQDQRRAVAQHAMAVLIGKSPADWTPPDFAIPENYGSLPTHMPVAVPSELVHDRPDILAAEARLHAATARIGVATAALYPSVTLSGGINQGGLTPAQVFQPIATAWNIGPTLNLPLFHQGELTAAKRQAIADARAALADYQQTVLTAFGQVADALQDVVHNNEAHAKQIESLDAARARLDMVRKGYAAGGSSALELVDAERTWQRSRLAFTQQSTSRYGAAALLLLATANVPPEVDRDPATDPKTPYQAP